MDTPDAVLSSLLALVAASDDELASRLHQANVIRLLQGIDAGLGFVFGELLDEILAVRQALDPSNRRATRLAILLAESEAMVVQAFAALGVNERVAAGLAKDPTVGFDVLGTAGEVLVLAAVAGSGKTLTALRTHQVDIVDAVLSRTAPVPVFVHTRALAATGLRDLVLSRTSEIDDCRVVGIRLVLDGLDEVGRSEAQRLLSEAAVLVSAWPSSSAVAFGRPDVPYNGVRTQLLQLPSAAGLERIANTIAGIPSPFWDFSPALRRAVELPLYAIAAAVLISRRREVPQSKAAIIEALIGVCLKEADLSNEASIRRLAVKLVSEGTASEATFGTAEAARLAISRIVVRDSRQLRFAVPIYQDWFAAQALLVDEVAHDVVPRGPEAFSRWRHAFALAMAMGSVRAVDDLAALLTETVPAGLRLILDESTSGAAPSVLQEAPADAAARIVRSLEATNSAFALPLSAAGREAVDPTATGVQVAGSWATIELRNTNGHALRQWGTLVDSREPAWPWRLAATRVADDLDEVVDRRLLHVDHPVVIAELVWAVARVIADDQSRLHPPIDADRVLDWLPDPDRFPEDEPLLLLGRRRRVWVHGHQVRRIAAAALLAQERGEQLIRPWPVPDNQDTRSGWQDDLYRPTTAALSLRDIRIAALEIYESLVRKWFADVSDFLATHATFPVANRCVYMPRRGSDRAATMWTKWIPLPVGSPSLVSFAVMEERPALNYEDARNEWTEGWQAIDREPPPFTKAWSSSHGIVSGLFSDRPATHLAYKWLSQDLKTLEWRKAMVPFDEPD